MLPNKNKSEFDSINLGGYLTTGDIEPIEFTSCCLAVAVTEIAQVAVDGIEIAKSYLAGEKNEMDELESLVQRAGTMSAHVCGCLEELEGLGSNLPPELKLLKEWVADTADMMTETHEALLEEKSSEEVEPPNQPQRSGTRSNLLDSESIPLGVRLAAEVGMAAALILQHFQYLLVEGYGLQIGEDRWLWNPRWKWIQDHFPCMSEWEYRKARDYLVERKLLKTCQPKKSQWNQTNYHTLDYESLKALILSIGEPPPIDWRIPKQRSHSPKSTSNELVFSGERTNTFLAKQRSHPPQSTPKTPATTTPVSNAEISGVMAETLDFVDWRASTNRLVTAHQSLYTEQTSKQTFKSSSISAGGETSSVFPPQTRDASTGGTQVKGQGASPFASLTPCPEPPPLCNTNDTQEGGILTASDPAIGSPADRLDSDSAADFARAAATPAPSKPTKSYSRVQLEALKRLGVVLNSGVMSKLCRASSRQIDDAITCFEEDKQSWSKTKPMNNPSGFFINVLKQVQHGRQPVQPNPIEQLQQSLQVWRDRWFSCPEISRPAMLQDIQANFANDIIVRDWNKGPVLGHSGAG